MARARRRDSGFSLIEVLVAMLVLSVGAASLLSLFAAGASTHRRAVDRTNAALLAERVIGELRASYSLGMEPAAVLERLAATLPAVEGEYRHEVTLFRPEGEEWMESELFARVTIRWKTGGSERTESFHVVLTPVPRPASARSGGFRLR